MKINKNDILDLDKKVKFFNDLYDKKKQFSRGIQLKIEDEYDRKVEREIGGGENTLLTVQYFLEHKKIRWRILYYLKYDNNFEKIKDNYYFTVVQDGIELSDKDYYEKKFDYFDEAKLHILDNIKKTYDKFPI